MFKIYCALILLLTAIKLNCRKPDYPSGRISRTDPLNRKYFQNISNIVSSVDLTGSPLKLGASADFYCVLNSIGLDEGYNSSNLSFSLVLSYYEGINYANRYNIFQGIPVELTNSKTQIVNETTILMRIEHVSIINAMLDCKLNNSTLLDEYRIYLGHKWMKSFGCISQKWEQMYCELNRYSLSTLIPNIPDFHVWYHFSSIPDIRLNPTHSCDNQHITSKASCRLSKFTYMKNYQYCIFKMTAVDSGRNITHKFVVNNFDSVVPGEIEEFTASNRTSNSVEILWRYPDELVGLPRNLLFWISYRAIYDTQWHTNLLGPVNVTKSDDGYLSMKLSHLTYAFAQYEVRIQSRILPKAFRWANFTKTDEYKSNITSLTFNTTGRIPDHPPGTDTGSFCVSNNGTVYLYADSVPPQNRNGDNFEYVFAKVGHRIHYSVRYNVVIYNDVTEADITFAVRSQNSLGMSEATNYITVPRLEYRCPIPINLKAIKTPDGTHYLAWQPPLNKLLKKSCPQVTSFTIFQHKGILKYGEEATISSKRKNNGTHQYNVTSQDVLIFAVSVNSFNSSSGMIWTDTKECAFSEIGKFESSAVKKKTSGRNSIELFWTLNCLEEHLVSSYVIKYCSVIDSHSRICTGKSLSLQVDHEPICNITHLIPFTWYMIEIQLITTDSSSPFSVPLVVRTLEDVPSPPRYLNYSDVTNTTAKLSWSRPQQLNGQLTVYILQYNDKALEIRANYSDSFDYWLKGLNSSQKYFVQVKACTSVGCSKNSNSVEFTTNIGNPGEISYLNKVEDEDQRMITWMPPLRPGGPIDYYELRQLITSDEDKQTIERIIKIEGTSCTLVSPGCQSGSFSVRAVNVFHERSLTLNSISHDVTESEPSIASEIICEEQDEIWSQQFVNSTTLPGVWSSPLQILCGSEYSFIYYIPLILIICVVFTTYGTIIMKNKLKRMANILVELPPGLVDIKKESIALSFRTDIKTGSSEDQDNCSQPLDMPIANSPDNITGYGKRMNEPSIAEEAQKGTQIPLLTLVGGERVSNSEEIRMTSAGYRPHSAIIKLKVVTSRAETTSKSTINKMAVCFPSNRYRSHSHSALIELHEIVSQEEKSSKSSASAVSLGGYGYTPHSAFPKLREITSIIERPLKLAMRPIVLSSNGYTPHSVFPKLRKITSSIERPLNLTMRAVALSSDGYTPHSAIIKLRTSRHEGQSELTKTAVSLTSGGYTPHSSFPKLREITSRIERPLKLIMREVGMSSDGYTPHSAFIKLRTTRDEELLEVTKATDSLPSLGGYTPHSEFLKLQGVLPRGEREINTNTANVGSSSAVCTSYDASVELLETIAVKNDPTYSDLI